MVQSRVILVACLILTAVVYLPVRSSPFVYEDAQSMAAPVQWGIPSRVLTSASLHATPSPRMAHLGNVAIHLANGTLVYAVAETVLGVTAAPMAAVLFLLHPVQSEAVNYVSGRTDLLVTFGTLIAVLAALHGAWLEMAVGLLIAAVSKEIGLVAVPLVALTLLIWRREDRSTRIAVCACIVGAGVVMGLAGHAIVGWLTMTGSNGGSGDSLLEYAFWQSTATWWLASRWIVPTHFTIDHDWIAMPYWVLQTAWTLTCFAPIAIALAWRRWEVVSWGLAWMLIAVAPRFIFRQSELLHEQHVYLSGVALSVVGGAAWSAIGSWCAGRLAVPPWTPGSCGMTPSINGVSQGA